MTNRPNILLLMTDQQRWDAIGSVSDWLETPNIDRIAAEGVRFDNAHTQSPVCVPARVSLATGRYPHDHGVWKNIHFELPADTPTWMRSVREAGYVTSMFGKAHLHPHFGDLRDRLGLMQSLGLDHVDEISGPRATMVTRSNMTDRLDEAGLLDVYLDDLRSRYQGNPWEVRPSALPLEHYPDVYVGQQAARHLRGLGTDRPWMCWVSFGGPHEPWDCPEPYASRFAPDDMPRPARRTGGPGRERPKGRIDRRWHSRPDLERGDIARMRADYAGSIALIDDQIGDILAVLEERGELDNTVIAFTSDHGEMNGDFGLTYKGTFFDGATRVPFIVRAPGLAAGGVSDEPVELIDMGATLVELAGGAPTPGSHALSVVPTLADPTHPHRDVALSEQSGEAMLVTREWKIVVNEDAEPYLLFDRRTDPEESTNMAGLPEVADQETELSRLLLRRLIQTTPAAPEVDLDTIGSSSP